MVKYLTIQHQQLPILRLAPIGEGRFEGRYHKHWPAITLNAYAAAFVLLTPAQQTMIRKCRVFFCIQNSGDTQAYKTALEDMLTPKPQPQQTTDVADSVHNHTIIILWKMTMATKHYDQAPTHRFHFHNNQRTAQATLPLTLIHSKHGTKKNPGQRTPTPLKHQGPPANR
jgi:hypothetical protein